MAATHGFEYLDTASDYGQSESALGQATVAKTSFKIVTKTPGFPDAHLRSEHKDVLITAFRRSLRRMGVDQVAGLLVHNANDLLKPGGEWLYAAMEELHEEGLVGRIGASVYGERQIAALLRRYPIQTIQAPLSVLDQRLIESGMLDELHRCGIEVHARSVFLQGLILASIESIGPEFARLRPQLREFLSACASRGLSARHVALGFVRCLPQVNVMLVGVNSVSQLSELIDAADVRIDAAEWRRFALNDEQILDPSRWQRK